ncbi:MAG TPA: hypothetical protein VF812_10000 [Ktedonobacterales bacterium]
MTERRGYLERYLAGEYEPVWAELEALGAAVRDEPVYRDALAVARETMRRVRENLEALIPRLVKAGYQFGYGWVQPPVNASFGWRLRQTYRDLLEDAKLEPPILTVGRDVEEQLADRRATMQRLRELDAPAIIMQNEERMLAELEARPRPAAQLRELEDQVGMLPLSVRAWYEVGGGVHLVGVHPGWVQLLAEAGLVDASFWERGFWELGGHAAFDPEAGRHPMLQLEPLLINALGGHGPVGTDVLFSHPVADGRYSLALTPNVQNAYLEQGQDGFSYTIEVPCACADAPLLHERHNTTFVNYLRICLRWAGFPGWERLPVRPERDITTLTAGLLPF